MRFLAALTLVTFGLSLPMVACGDDEPAQGSANDDVAAGGPGGADTTKGPDVAATPDAGPSEDVAVDTGPVGPIIDRGDSYTGGVVVYPEALEGRFVFGLGTPPASFIARFGGSAAGLFAMPVVLELGDTMVIRVLDRDTLEPVAGDEGVIESYPYTTLSDGRIALDFAQPTKTIEIVLNGPCKVVQNSYTLAEEPIYRDSLMTWRVNETYSSQGCTHAFPPITGEHVHFLRREDASTGFTPRAPVAGSPFGFFIAEAGGDEWLTRLPKVAPGEADETVTYLISDSVPLQYRPIVHGVFDSWNDALEAAIGQRPFVVEDAPPGVLAWDPRYRVVLWDGSQSQGAVAPFIEDPFTGEMFETYVVLWLGDIDVLIESYSAFFTANPDALGPAGPGPGFAPPSMPEPTMPLPAAATETPAREGRAGAMKLRSYPMRAFGQAELAMYYDQLAADLTDQEIAIYVVADFLVHEVGHNLGLRHNFVASADKDLTPEGAPATSTMDYVMGMVTPGVYDIDAMRYGYGDGATETGYLYCTDGDSLLDPACQTWDYGHPILWQLSHLNAAALETNDTATFAELDEQAWYVGWYDQLRSARLFVNSDWEAWDAAEEVDTFAWALARVDCSEACSGHPWFRAQWAIHLLAARFGLQYGWGANAVIEWHDYPAIDATQVAILSDTVSALLLDPETVLDAKLAIVASLPDSGFADAGPMLASLAQTVNTLPEPSADDATLLDAIVAAQVALAE